LKFICRAGWEVLRFPFGAVFFVGGMTIKDKDKGSEETKCWQPEGCRYIGKHKKTPAGISSGGRFDFFGINFCRR
jgi:hypothetical protein